MKILRGIFATVVSAVTIASLSVTPAAAWKTQQSASAYCSEANSAVISWSFTNTESNQSQSMDVIATDLASGKSSPKVTAGAGQTVTGTIVPGDKNIGQGTVKFELTWTDGHSGIDSRKANYNATNCVEEPKQIQVCRDGKVITIKEDERRQTDTNLPCPSKQIEVCRDGKIITIDEEDKRSTDTNAPCVLGEEHPKELPNTGIESVLGGTFATGAMGLSVKSWLESRSMLKKGLKKKQ